VAIVGLGVWVGFTGIAVVIVLVLSLSSLLRDDRRGAFERIAGVWLDSTMPAKTTREERLAEAEESKRKASGIQ
jgi:hypothetical protein